MDPTTEKPVGEFLTVVMDGARRLNLPCVLVVFGDLGTSACASSRAMDRVNAGDLCTAMGRVIQKIAPPDVNIEEAVCCVREGIIVAKTT